MSPWKVLGIARTTDLRAIQKAYANCLRQHRPDEDPEGYQRVRAAYEAAVEASRSNEVDDTADGVTFDPTSAAAEEPAAAELTIPVRGPYDATVVHLRQLTELIAQSATESDARWQALFDDEVLVDLQVRPWLSRQVFRLVAEHCRDRADLYTSGFHLVVRRYARELGWVDDELDLAREFSPEDVDRVMGIAMGWRGHADPPVSRTGRKKSWAVWGSILVVIFGLQFLSSAYHGIKGDGDRKALAQATEAIRAGRYANAVSMLERRLLEDPFNRDATLLLSQSLLGLHEVDRAEKLLSEAIAMRPTDAGALYLRARIFSSQHRDKEASRDLLGAHQSAPQDPTIANAAAWLLATSPDESVRDGGRAVELAQLVVGASEHPWAGHIDTLAAAFAEAGNFPEAASEQRRAIAALSEKDESIRAELEARLGLYVAGRPYRDPEH